jgi:hypothetical protein
MKVFVAIQKTLQDEGRWDIDYHLPPVGLNQFQKNTLKQVNAAADLVKSKRNPELEPDTPFKYIDISCVDVITGTISNPQDLTGEEAPSRARKVVHAFDLIISTCRPTRGAIAIVPVELHGEICSTGFSVIRAKKGVNPFYLQFALRLASTLEQFRKFSTGSSYPAILDDDVLKTFIPLPDSDTQDLIAKKIMVAARSRFQQIAAANHEWEHTVNEVTGNISSSTMPDSMSEEDLVYSIAQVEQILDSLSDTKEEISTEEGTQQVLEL